MLSNYSWLLLAWSSLGEAPSGHLLAAVCPREAAKWGGPSHCWLHDLFTLAAAGQLCFSLAKSLGSGLACLGLYSLVSTLPVGGHLLISVSRCLAPLSIPPAGVGSRADSKQWNSEWIALYNTEYRQA